MEKNMRRGSKKGMLAGSAEGAGNKRGRGLSDPAKEILVLRRQFSRDRKSMGRGG